jgi:hypothetical protein
MDPISITLIAGSISILGGTLGRYYYKYYYNDKYKEDLLHKCSKLSSPQELLQPLNQMYVAVTPYKRKNKINNFGQLKDLDELTYNDPNNSLNNDPNNSLNNDPNNSLNNDSNNSLNNDSNNSLNNDLINYKADNEI